MSQKHRGTLSIHVVEARALTGKDSALLPFGGRNVYDPWLEIVLEKKVIVHTIVHSNTSNPKFDVKTVVPYCYSTTWITVNVYDSDLLKNKLIGTAIVSLLPLDDIWTKEEWFPLDKGRGDVFMKMKFEPHHEPENLLVPEPLGSNFYFSPRRGGNMKLFQDAYSEVPKDITTRMAKDTEHNCFQNIYETLNKARKLIYIAGWSVFTELDLMRTEDQKESLGNLLIRKADEGVTVLIMIWNEAFSARMCSELFGTHDTATVKFFKNTRVSCVSVRRTPTSQCSVKEKVIETIYTHHMKFIVVDDVSCGLVAFIGGLDLTDGRWDYPGHPIWNTLATFHKNDFHNGFVEVPPEKGPREPWHDIHSRVEGEVAFDLLQSFEERWKRQASSLAYKIVPFTLGDIPANSPEHENCTWNLQILRSSDSDSSCFKYKSDDLQDHGNHQRDVSMERGYVQLVRSAKKFIYIESQYFIGSSYDWKGKYTDVAPNVVPAEIAEQIAFSIRSGSPIRAYLVIPMAPEGNPTFTIANAYMKDILLWQFLTFQMMYKRIASALGESKIDGHPEDYLLILCLGRKLSIERAERSFPGTEPNTNNEAKKWRERRRFLIYVHSKMALADDARIIVGSANMNERSLAGCRDTEIAVAGSQVQKKESKEEIVVNGEVHRLRKNLWQEHTEGESDNHPAYMDPNSLKCIQHMRQRATESLLSYIGDSGTDLGYRFLKYPISVNKQGHVSAMPEVPNIPDLDLPVVGSKSYIPTNITT